jgi:hypothetical protein
LCHDHPAPAAAATAELSSSTTEAEVHVKSDNAGQELHSHIALAWRDSFSGLNTNPDLISKAMPTNMEPKPLQPISNCFP